MALLATLATLRRQRPQIELSDMWARHPDGKTEKLGSGLTAERVREIENLYYRLGRSTTWTKPSR